MVHRRPPTMIEGIKKRQ